LPCKAGKGRGLAFFLVRVFDERCRIRIHIHNLRGLHLKLLRSRVRHPFCQGGLLWLRENILNRHGRELVGVCTRLYGFLIPNKRTIVIRDMSRLARTDFQGLLVVLNCAFGFRRSPFPV
jgi:hypothetical protein